MWGFSPSSKQKKKDFLFKQYILPVLLTGLQGQATQKPIDDVFVYSCLEHFC